MSSKRAKIISVVGGGFSFREVDHGLVPGFVIAANDAGLCLQRQVDEIVSMDRLWTEHRWEALQGIRTPTHLRRSAVQNVEWESESWAHVFDCDHTSVEFSDDPNTLNGTSSGTCALNRAYQLRPRKLFLFGFDMCRDINGNPYWYAPYPWTKDTGGTSNGKYNAWAAEFNRIALAFAQIECEVYNVSRHSKIMCFPRLTPAQLRVA